MHIYMAIWFVMLETGTSLSLLSFFLLYLIAVKMFLDMYTYMYVNWS